MLFKIVTRYISSAEQWHFRAHGPVFSNRVLLVSHSYIGGAEMPVRQANQSLENLENGVAGHSASWEGFLFLHLRSPIYLRNLSQCWPRSR